MKLLPTLLLSLLTITTLTAQPNLGSWQWAKKAGGVFNTASRENEVVNDICTDKYGNVYTTGIVYQDPYFEGVPYTAPFASFGGSDAFVAKYDKCGHLKWVRFGGGPQNDEATAIRVDDSLNVYILGNTASYNITFPDSNHTVTATHPGLFWAKYDSIGNIKWLNVSNNNGTQTPLLFSRLISRPNGNLSTVLFTDTGNFSSGFSYHTHFGYAIFEFDLNGNPVKIQPIDSLSFNASYSTLNLDWMAYDSKSNMIFNYAIFDTTHFFDTVLYTPSGNGRYFVIKVDYQTHKIKWIKEWKEDQFQESGFYQMEIDNVDNILMSGSGGVGGVFNDDTIKFNSTAATYMEICFKLDSNGNTLWHIVADNTNNANEPVYSEPITLLGNQYVCSIINVSGPTYWGGDTFNYVGSTPYILTFINSNTGKVEYATAPLGGANITNTILVNMTSDEQGNIYTGGYFSQGIIAGNTINNIGGINDAFVLKWGLPCPDTNALIPPLAALDLVASASGLHAIDVNWHNVAQYADRYRVYRSTTDSLTGYSLIDSVSKYTTQYTDAHVVSHQIYWYRVSAVNHAGETFSNSDSAIIAPTGIDELSDIRHIALYPDPANNYTKLSVWSDAALPFSATISLTDIEGRESYTKQTEIIQGKNDFIIDLSEISAGVYIVNLRCNNETYSKRLVVIK